MTHLSSGPFDLVVRGAILVDGSCVAIGIKDGCFAAIEPSLPAAPDEIDLGGRLVCGGLVETHLHLDKSRLIDRCGCGHPSLAHAVEAVAEAKRHFTVKDIYRRAAATLEACIGHGTTHIRTHVEVDPRVGLRGLEAMIALRRDYAWAIELQICAFPQEGLTNDPGCEALLVEALENGADLLGGAPYMDAAPREQLQRLFTLASAYDVDLDLHLDFDLDPEGSQIGDLCRLTAQHKRGGRVAIGHLTKLAMVSPLNRIPFLHRLADAGIAVSTLPATDIYLLGKELGVHAPRALAPVHAMVDAGISCAISTNNVLNPFTPFGDSSLLRLANFHANVAQLDSKAAMDRSFDMISAMAARCINAEYGIAVGRPATFVALDAASPEQAIREIAPPLLGFRHGRRSFTRAQVELHHPEDRTDHESRSSEAESN